MSDLKKYLFVKDFEATFFMFRRLHKHLDKKFYRKQKHNSAFRTVSDRKWAGHKRNKPKYNWSKKRKAQMKVWL